MSFHFSAARSLGRLALLALFLGAGPLAAVEPVVRNLNLRGLQVGGQTTLVIDGDGLGTEPRLLLPFDAKQELKGKATDKQATFLVTLPADVPAGYYHLRVATDGGVSLPAVVGIDRLQQLSLAATVPQLPVALTGSVTGS